MTDNKNEGHTFVIIIVSRSQQNHRTTVLTLKLLMWLVSDDIDTVYMVG